MNSSVSFQGYKSVWDTRYSKGRNSRGYLYELDPDVGCNSSPDVTSPRVPNVTNSSVLWFAVLAEYPRCSMNASKDIKRAGFRLAIIGDGVNSSASKLHGLLYIFVSEKYCEYLISNALSDITQPDVVATLDTFDILLTLVTAVSSVMFVALVIVVFMTCNRLWLRWKRQSRRVAIETHEHPTFPPPEPVRTYWDRFTASIRLPLGPEQTKKLPNKKYERLGSLESCGICFEELKNGDEVRDLPCGHNNFHTSCLDQWLLTCNRSCPLCRHNVTKQRPAPQARASGVKESSNSLLSDMEDQNYGTML